MKQISIEIIHKCPNRCLHCSSNSDINCTLKIETAEVKKIIDSASKLNTEVLNISGGEPFLHDGLLEIVHYALAGLKTIFMQGYQYKKAGVIITEITDSTQLGLFDSVDREKRERLQQTIDKINGKHSRLVKLAIQGTGRNWKLKQKQLSGHYTTDINQIISINCTYPTACQRKQYS